MNWIWGIVYVVALWAFTKRTGTAIARLD